jgi:hypothetical protein
LIIFDGDALAKGVEVAIAGFSFDLYPIGTRMGKLTMGNAVL